MSNTSELGPSRRDIINFGAFLKRAPNAAEADSDGLLSDAPSGITDTLNKIGQTEIPNRWRVRLPVALATGLVADKLGVFSLEPAEAQEFDSSNIAPLFDLTNSEQTSFLPLRTSWFGDHVPDTIFPVSAPSIQVEANGHVEGIIDPEPGSPLDALLYGTNGSEISLAGTQEGITITLPEITNLSTLLSKTLETNGEQSVSLTFMTDERGSQVKVFPILQANQPIRLQLERDGQTAPIPFRANTLLLINPDNGKLHILEHSGSTLTEVVAVETTPDFSSELSFIGINAPVRSLSIIEREQAGERNLHTIITENKGVVVGYWDVAVKDGSRLRATPNGDVVVDKYNANENKPILSAEFEFSPLFTQLKQDFPDLARGQYGLFETQVNTGQFIGTWYLYSKDAKQTEIAWIHESRVDVTFINALSRAPIPSPEAPLNSADLLARELGLPEDRSYRFDTSVVYGNIRMLKDTQEQVWAACPEATDNWQTAQTLQDSLGLDTQAEDGTQLHYFLAGDQGNLFLREKRDETHQRGVVAMLDEKLGTWYDLREPFEQMLLSPTDYGGPFEVTQGEHYVTFHGVNFGVRTDLQIPISETDGLGNRFLRVFWVHYPNITGNKSMETALVTLDLRFQGTEIYTYWDEKDHEQLTTKGTAVIGRFPLGQREMDQWFVPTTTPDRRLAETRMFFQQYLDEKLDTLTELMNRQLISEPLVWDLWQSTDPRIHIHFA